MGSLNFVNLTTRKIDQTYTISPRPRGIHWDGRGLYVVDNNSLGYYTMHGMANDDPTGTTTFSGSIPNYAVSGRMTGNGTTLWMGYAKAIGGGPVIYVGDMATFSVAVPGDLSTVKVEDSSWANVTYQGPTAGASVHPAIGFDGANIIYQIHTTAGNYGMWAANIITERADNFDSTGPAEKFAGWDYDGVGWWCGINSGGIEYASEHTNYEVIGDPFLVTDLTNILDVSLMHSYSYSNDGSVGGSSGGGCNYDATHLIVAKVV